MTAKIIHHTAIDRRESQALIYASMPSSYPSLLDTKTLRADDIFSLFRLADRFRRRSDEHGFFYKPGTSPPPGSKIVSLLFFEASTRTRMSFQQAAYRLGLPVLTMESSSSSVTKGETLTDTVLNVLAMKPDCLVIRYGESAELDTLLPELPIPVINAGNGTHAHPTQGLLDAYTILKERGQIEGEKVLIVGDLRHSRVARSNFDVLSKLGALIGVCGPDDLLPTAEEMPGARIFRDLEEGMRWATVCMGLRIQFERHAQDDVRERVAEYHRLYGISRVRLQSLVPAGILMHPGPINHGVEFSSDVLQDPRSRVLAQVSNGVLLRAALLARLLDLERE